MAAQLYVQTYGDPSLPALILVHGAGAASRSWRRQAALADRFHVLAVDLPGFARSPGPFTLAGAVEAVAALAREHSPAHLCGHSLGAMVATEAAAHSPQAVDRLVLVGPAIAPADSEPRRIRFYRTRAGWWLMRALSDLPDRGALLALVEQLVLMDTANAATRVTAPTLVICGRRDRACLPDAHRLADLISTARLLVVPHTGHLLPATHPKVFNTILAGFLNAAR